MNSTDELERYRALGRQILWWSLALVMMWCVPALSR